MHVSSILRTLLGALVAVGAIAAQAAEFNFSGNLFNNTDRVHIAFDISSVSDVRLWTDSWNSGANFDPISALWMQTGSDYTLVQEVDDDDTVASGQGFYDTGLSLTGLAAGHYLYTVGASFLTPFAAGSLLSQGFTQDGIAPTPIAVWNQPSYDINANDQKGTLYSINLSGVEGAAIAAVPEPGSYAMLLAGLGLLGVSLRGRQKKD